ncbi:MAG: polyphosphate kinase 2 family protein [Chitinivibrionales bacterium]|nr:polyphosphate kinase 2 family protein [Chitinivibrionales bacterium]
MPDNQQPPIDHTQHLVEPDARPDLSSIPSRFGEDEWKSPAKKLRARLHKQLQEQQNLLFAEHKRAVLVVLQAPDAAGKDSTIRRCFGVLNPQRCRTHSFVKPNRRERDHDFLWRIHFRTPGRGKIGIFNRSHYEAVLIEKVKSLVSEEQIQARYDHINAFEKMLHDEGTTIIKFYLHISRAYQKRRFERRLRRADKRWKFSKNDLSEREYWDDYMAAYEQVFARCSPGFAPWYIVPAERRWYRDVVILRALLDKMQSMHLQLPRPDISLKSVTIPD